MTKTHYFKIAGHAFAIEGDTCAMEPLDEFEVFATGSSEPEFGIRLHESESPGGDGEIYHTLRTQSVVCRFTRSVAGYGLALAANDGQRLSVQHIPAQKTVEITGRLAPGLLRLALWAAFGLATLESRTAALHASAVLYNGRAILFLGESGTGKSTQARLWQEHIAGVVLLNDDSPILRIENGRCYAYGSPWSGKTPCYKPMRAEVGAIIRLSQAPCNRMRGLTTHEAISALYPSFPPGFTADAKLSEHVCTMLSQMLRRVPVYHLACLPNRQAVRMAFETVRSVVLA